MGLMNVLRDWICPACGTENQAGSALCGKCDSAATSGSDSQGRSCVSVAAPGEAKDALHHSAPQKFAVNLLMVVLFAGTVIERLTYPTMFAWWVGISMMFGSFLLLFVLRKPWKSPTSTNESSK